MIKIFKSTETDFSTNGEAVLSDAISCDVKKQISGMRELTMVYPINGEAADLIVQRAILSVLQDNVKGYQAYRIYNVRKNIDGTLTVSARHIAYDLQGIIVMPFSGHTLGDVMDALNTAANIIGTSPFTFSTNFRTTVIEYTLAVPADIWTVMGKGNSGLLSRLINWEWDFNGYSISINSPLSWDRGLQIRYGKNLTSLQQDENCAECYTGVLPYWKSPTSGTIVTLSGSGTNKVVSAPGTFDYTRVLPVDFSADYESAPSDAQLSASASAYISEHGVGKPKVSLSVDWAQADKVFGFEDVDIDPPVDLGDLVSVYFPLLNVSSKARVSETFFDSILGKYKKINIGDIPENVAVKISKQGKQIAKTEKQVDNIKTETDLEIISAPTNQTIYATTDTVSVTAQVTATGYGLTYQWASTTNISDPSSWINSGTASSNTFIFDAPGEGILDPLVYYIRVSVTNSIGNMRIPPIAAITIYRS